MKSVDNFIDGGRVYSYNDYHDMEQIKITRVIRNGTSLSVTIPKEILQALKIERGDQVAVSILNEKSIIISKISREQIRGINLPEI